MKTICPDGKVAKGYTCIPTPVKQRRNAPKVVIDFKTGGDYTHKPKK